MGMDLSLIGAGLSAGSNFSNNLFNLYSTNKANKLNYRMFQEGNQFAHDEAELAFNRSADFQREMFNAENLYNSPLEMLKRLQAAGLSPFDYFSNGNYQGASSQQAYSPAATSAVSHAMQAPTLDLNMNGAINAFAQVVQTLADKKLKSAEADRLLKLTGAEFEKMLSEKNYTDSLKANSDFDRFLKDYKLPYQIQQMMADFRVALTKGDLQEAQKLLTKAEESRVWEESKTTRDLRPYLVANARRLYDVYSSEIVKNRAAASESYSHAGLMDSQKTYQELINDVQIYETEYARTTGEKRVEWIHNNLDKFVNSLDNAIDAQITTDWAKYQKHKRLAEIYQDLNNNRNKRVNRYTDNLLQYITNELGISLSANGSIIDKVP